MEVGLFGGPRDDGLDEGLGDIGIDGIHAQLIAAKGAPAEGQFGEVARANDEAAELIGLIHQDLGAFAGLRIFEGGICGEGVVSDVGKMLGAGLDNGDFLEGESESLGESQGIGVRA